MSVDPVSDTSGPALRKKKEGGGGSYKTLILCTHSTSQEKAPVLKRQATKSDEALVHLPKIKGIQRAKVEIVGRKL